MAALKKNACLIVSYSDGYELHPYFTLPFYAKNQKRAFANAHKHIVNKWDKIKQPDSEDIWVAIEFGGLTLKSQYRYRKRVCKWYHPATLWQGGTKAWR